MEQNTIPIYIGYDFRERAATNVLIDSIYQNTSKPVSITPLVTSQLEYQGLYWRSRDSKQSTDFSFTRFLVPYLMDYEGWAIFMDCDMLCFSDIKELWDLRDENYSLLCVHHDQKTSENTKFLGEKQTNYPKKNWSSLMLLNCKQCKKLTLDYVNSASGLELHRFLWLEGDHKIGEIDMSWNYLVGVDKGTKENNKIKFKNIHWTLGGPWFKKQRTLGGNLAAKWFSSRDEAMKLWE